MKAVTIREAKAHLNELIQAATRGEQVVLMRGSKHVAAIVPLSADELELPPRLSDPQAERFWRWLAEGRRGESRLLFESPEEAVGFLSRPRAKRPRRSGRSVAGERRRRPA
jgi:prevent-host-death family protein